MFTASACSSCFFFIVCSETKPSSCLFFDDLNSSKFPEFKFSFGGTYSITSGMINNPASLDSTLASLKLKQSPASDDSSNVAFKKISSIYYGDSISVKKPMSKRNDNAKESQSQPGISWLSNIYNNNLLLQRKGHSRKKKQRHLFEFSQENRFNKLVRICAKVLGPEATIALFGKVGRDPGIKGYNELIEMCIEKARESSDEDIVIEELGKVFHLFKLMGERGFRLEEQSYRPLLLYTIDMCMVEEFHFFYDAIKDQNASLITRLGYYEMMLWLRVNNEEKIQEICNLIAENDGEEISDLRENYLLALCECERKKEILELLEIINIKKLSSVESVEKIFQALGRHQLEPVVENFLLDFKTSDYETNNITNFIASYAVSIPNLSVENVITKFKDLHQTLEVSPSSSSYERLILHSCTLREVRVALDIVDEMCEGGLTLSNEMLQSILQTCEETSEYNLVHRIFSTIRQYNLETNDKTFRCMIDLFLKMKDLEGAYRMLDEMGELNLKPSASMYNTIMAECFREKNTSDGVRVLEHMQNADVMPDSETFSYLISNSETEEDIVMYYKELKESGIKPTKQIFMALINAYAACGQLEKAKQVVLDPLIPQKNLNQIKYVLVSVLAAHGQLSEAIHYYEEIKKAGHNLEPKDVMNLIEKTRSDVELDRLLLLLEELNDTDYWNGACCRIILYCIWNKDISSAVNLCKLLKNKYQSDELVTEVLCDKHHSNELVMKVLFDKVFSLINGSESSHLQASLELLSEIKDKLGLVPPKEYHDSLLSAHAKTSELHNAN
ncbi:pentatricopeptide repeat-containing protein At4g04790, mitochondrial isoform X1 [Arachis hypogaea]|uniref:pentatricopeptide repeat-containing protein At4g04790, mitochondrial isoform X1 n=2 Tax=Arachis hypogaea TaxID=3818 RepID=UPI000DED3142|nr:pentatricopeptide repeat-containing protein At4g04790, mitochondrial isoform X2 [Arachis hypogaea]